MIGDDGATLEFRQIASVVGGARRGKGVEEEAMARVEQRHSLLPWVDTPTTSTSPAFKLCSSPSSEPCVLDSAMNICIY